MPSSRFMLAILAALAVSAGTAAAAADAPERTVVGNIVLAGGGMSLNQAIAMVERRFKARVVRSDVRQEGDRKIYVLRLLDDAGNAQVVRVDAASGAIL
ncbi:MAG TPA: PepSY domain-containing protein [Steroidobacteraceae bacterium]|nr:PepSY domain-containing protein [Steroidobacteraceae bacterium]